MKEMLRDFNAGRIDISEMSSHIKEDEKLPPFDAGEKKIKPDDIENSRDFQEDTPESFIPENKSFHKKMSEGGRAIVGQVFEAAGKLSEKGKEFSNNAREGVSEFSGKAAEGIYNLPGVARFLGKMEITYNQFWADKHEEKAVELKGKVDSFDLAHNILGESRKEIESLIAEFKKDGTPGVESLSLRLKEIDEKGRDLLNKKGSVQSKLESRVGKIGLYTTERDRVADNLIGRYEKRLDPIEKDLEKLKFDSEELNLNIEVTKIKHSQQEERLDLLEKKKDRLAESYKKSGMKEGKIIKDEAIKTLGEQILEGRKKIAAEKESMANQKFEISRRIAETNEKANPLRDKKDQFIRIKQNRPIEINVEDRKREVNVDFEEKVGNSSEEEHVEETEEESLKEGIEDSKGRLPVSFLTSKWNEYLQDTNRGNRTNSELVEINDFSRTMRLQDTFRLNSKEFKKVMELYYNKKKVPVQKSLKKDFEMFEKKIRTE